MDPALLITGVIVGFLVAAPVGPVAVLCIHRTLLDGRLTGYSTGLGAAVGDTVFGALAIFSVAAVEGFLLEHRFVIQVLGSLVLVALGARTAMRPGDRRSAAEVESDQLDHETLLHAFGSAFAITIVNPITIVAFISVFAAIRVSEATSGLLSSWLVVAGVFAGSAGWWFLLGSITSVFRQRFTGKGLRWMNAISGITILGFGVYGLLDLALR